MGEKSGRNEREAGASKASLPDFHAGIVDGIDSVWKR